MSTKSITELKCDRCSTQVVLREGGVTTSGWGQVSAVEINGSRHIGTLAFGQKPAVPADLCPNCQGALVAWFLDGKPEA